MPSNFLMTHRGLRLLDSQALKLVNNMIPSALKDIYFTDEDRALSFIEANAEEKTSG